MKTALNSYDAKVDSKKRLTLRNTPFEYYHVEEYEDGRVVLYPRELTAPIVVSVNTLEMMDSAIKNIKNDIISDAIDLTEFEGWFMFEIHMGVPEMDALWKDLTSKIKNDSASKDEVLLYKKLGNCLKKLSNDLKYPGLQSHEIKALSARYGIKVWQSYLENNVPAAGRLFWIYGPNKNSITVIGLEPHPNDKSNEKE